MGANTINKPRTVQHTELTPGAFVVIRGNIEYSRLLTPIDGEELEKDKLRKTQNGIQPITKPYTSIQITNARVLPRDPGGIMTKEELYVDQRMYQRVADGANGPWHFTCNNKNASQPNQFYMARPNSPTEADRFIPERELANGLDVVLVLRIFESAAFQRKGISLHAIILQEPVRYYASNNDKALNAAGVILHDDNNVAAQVAAQNPAQAQPAAPAAPASQVSAPAGSMYSSEPQPQPQAPAPAPQQQAYPQQTYQQPPQPQAPAQNYQQPPQAPAPAPAPQAPVQAAPAAAAPQEWVCPTCQNRVPIGMAFCGSCGTHRPDNVYAAQAAAATAGAQTRPGINYDPNQRDY